MRKKKIQWFRVELIEIWASEQNKKILWFRVKLVPKQKKKKKISAR